MMTRDYLSVKVWDLNMESRPVETYQVRLADAQQQCVVLALLHNCKWAMRDLSLALDYEGLATVQGNSLTFRMTVPYYVTLSVL